MMMRRREGRREGRRNRKRRRRRRGVWLSRVGPGWWGGGERMILVMWGLG